MDLGYERRILDYLRLNSHLSLCSCSKCSTDVNEPLIERIQNARPICAVTARRHCRANIPVISGPRYIPIRDCVELYESYIAGRVDKHGKPIADGTATEQHDDAEQQANTEQHENADDAMEIDERDGNIRDDAAPAAPNDQTRPTPPTRPSCKAEYSDRHRCGCYIGEKKI